jgi:hypothetical protein
MRVRQYDVTQVLILTSVKKALSSQTVEAALYGLPEADKPFNMYI